MSDTNGIVFTIAYLADKQYHLFYFENRHRCSIKGNHTGKMVDAFRFMFPDAILINQKNYHWFVNRQVQQRRQHAIEEIEAYSKE